MKTEVKSWNNDGIDYVKVNSFHGQKNKLMSLELVILNGTIWSFRSFTETPNNGLVTYSSDDVTGIQCNFLNPQIGEC